MHSRSSGSLSSRLLKFRDAATPLGAAVWAPNSIEIFCGRKAGQAYLFGLAFLFSCCALHYAHSWLAGVADGIMMRDLTGRRFGLVLWFNVVFLSLLTMSSVLFVRAGWEGAFGAPSAAAAFFSESFSVGGALSALSVLAEVLQIVSGQHKPGWTIGRSCAPGGIAFMGSACALWSLSLWCLWKTRGDFFIPAYLGMCILMSCFFWQMTSSPDENPNVSFQAVLFWLSFVALALLVIFLVNGIRVRKAAQEQCHQMRRQWMVRQDAPTDLVVYNEVVGREQVDRLSALAATVQQQLDSQFISARAAVPKLARWFPGPTDRYGPFSAQGKYRQRSSDLDKLYEQASLLDAGALQLLVQQLLKPLQQDAADERRRAVQPTAAAARVYPLLMKGPLKKPERAMEKCVRSYRRDAGQLTDLVRFSIIVEDFEQLISVFCAFCDVSAVGTASPSVSSGGAAQRGRARAAMSTPSSLLSPTSPSRKPRSSTPVPSRSRPRGERGRPASLTAPFSSMFRMTQVKNRFDPNYEKFGFVTGFRGLTINLEVGWSLRGSEIETHPIDQWDHSGVQQHIFEVQIHVEGWYQSLKSPGVRAAYREFRDLVSR